MTPHLDPQAPMQPQGNWFSRNWKWLVPVGCMVPMLCCGGIGGVAYFTVSTVIKGSPAFTEAVSKASENEEVKAAIGTPITGGFWVSGQMKETNGEGTADFTVPIEGPKGSGSMHVVARRSGGAWIFRSIVVETKGKTIDVGRPSPPDVPEEGEEPDEPDEPDGD